MVLTAAALVAALGQDVGPGRDAFASAVLAPRRIPSRVGRHASRTVDAAIAASARSTHSSQADRNSHRKNFLGMTLAASETASFSGDFRCLTRFR
jgi:hypothetical protein